MSSPLRRVEAGVAALLTLATIWLHFVAVTSAGGLWRDEANTVGMATLPTLRDIGANLQYDSFPMLWLLVVRMFSAVAGPMNDPALRGLGFAVGVGIIGMLWINARTLGHSFPFFSVTLLGFSPSVIIWGDSMRAYGFGILLILLTAALLWRFVGRPSTVRLCAAGLAALASVHTLFYNSVLLLALSAGAVAVCATERKWRPAGLIVLIGVVSAASLVPYLPAIRAAGSWNMLVRMPDYTLSRFWEKLEQTLEPVGWWALGLWVMLFALSLVAALVVMRPRRTRALTRGQQKRAAQTPSGKRQSNKRERSSSQRKVAAERESRTEQNEKDEIALRQRRVALFTAVTLIVAVPGYFLFLDRLSYPTQPWYYLSLLAIAALCIDAIFGAVIRDQPARIARLVVVVAVAGVSLIPASRVVRIRLTNVDRIAEQLQRSSERGDVVVVTPWYHAVSFSRYYQGPAELMTIPTLPFHRFHRYDQIKKHMMATDQTQSVQEVIERAGSALRAGHRVFIVGWHQFPQPAQPPVLPPAPMPGQGWPSDLYTVAWSRHVAYFLERHSATLADFPVESPGRVSPYEDLLAIVATGWRP